MALLKHNTSERTSSMFSSNTMSRGNYGFNSNGSNSSGLNNVSSNGSNNNNFYANSVAPFCIMCKPERHRWTECKFNTPQKRRDRLVVVGRCQACLLPVDTHGFNCSTNARCNDHPNDNHVHWTCDGRGTVHPGPQAAITWRNRGNNSR